MAVIIKTAEGEELSYHGVWQDSDGSYWKLDETFLDDWVETGRIDMKGYDYEDMWVEVVHESSEAAKYFNIASAQE